MRAWLCLGLLSCSTPEPAPRCDGTLEFIHDGGTDREWSTVERALDDFLAWTDFDCLSEISLTNNAFAAGNRWRAEDGWKIALRPNDTVRSSALNQLCGALLDELALEDAPDTVQQLTRLCASGPVRRAFEAQTSACRLPELSEEDAFMRSRVFTAHRDAAAARTVRLQPGSPIILGPLDDLGRTWHRADDGYLAWAQHEGGYTAENHGPSGIETRFEITDPQFQPPGITSLLTHDAVYWLDSIPYDDPAFRTALFIADDSGVQEMPIENLGYVGSSPTPLLLGRELFLEYTGYLGGSGAIYAVDIDHGSFRALAIPPPPDPGAVTAVRSIWPASPTSIWVAYSWYYADYHSDPISITTLESRIALLDVQTGGWTDVPQLLPGERLPSFTPFDTRDDGALWGTIPAGEDRLVAALLPDGSFEVADGPCLNDELPQIDIDGTLYSLDYDDGEARWRPWSITR